MGTYVLNSPFTVRIVFLAGLLLLAAGPASARQQTLNDWQARYQASSTSGDSGGCQLCHAEPSGGDPWNAYGWDIRDALNDDSCDLNGNGDVSNQEAFFCVELANSDNDGSGYDNASEIGLSTQPGWTGGANNTLYFRSGLTDTGQFPPEGLGNVDPAGTEPPPPPPPPPPADEEDLPPGQMKRRTIVVKPGQSIQAAIDRAHPGTRIYILAGDYREQGNATNALQINKSGIKLIGQQTRKKKVVLKNAGNQRNGIVVVPSERNECMSCHVSLKPPFPLHPNVEPGMPDEEPVIHGFEIRNIAIEGFGNNGLFTERVENFRIINVESIDNPNYGIFPTLSRNGLISHSRATGADDSGIWVETSENVKVVHNLVEANVNGLEISNSEDILIAHNEIRYNTVGIANLLLPDIFDDRPGSKRITMRDNWIYDNNNSNTARPGSILASVPPGTGILHVGVDDSLIANNRIENNNFFGIVMADYCAVVEGTQFACGLDPDTLTPGFIEDNGATNNRVIGNTLINNGASPVPHPFGFAAADLSLVVLGLNGNCFADNAYSTEFSTLGFLPPCD